MCHISQYQVGHAGFHYGKVSEKERGAALAEELRGRRWGPGLAGPVCHGSRKRLLKGIQWKQV